LEYSWYFNCNYNFNIHNKSIGPWIVAVEYGHNDLFIEEAHSKYKKKYYDENFKTINNYKQHVHFSNKYSFVDKTGLNAGVLNSYYYILIISLLLLSNVNYQLF
jgi:hypothetical protein